jgi:hypothetical protein
MASRYKGGSVALIWNGHDEPGQSGGSGRKAEELVDETDFACRSGLRQDAMAATDHPHDLKALQSPEAVVILWKPRVGRIIRLSAP